MKKLLAQIDQHILALKIEGNTVESILQSAYEEGFFSLNNENKIVITHTPNKAQWIAHIPDKHPRKHYPSCHFLSKFLFQVIYKQKAIPLACQQCYKVKIYYQNVEQLVSFKAILEKIDHVSKSGCELDSPISQGIWSSYIYTHGLDMAFDIYDTILNIIQKDPKKWESLRIVIKRGCTEFELALGPSQDWVFENNIAKVEDALLKVFEVRTININKDEIKMKDRSVYINWLKTAHQIGDNSYLKLTNEQSFYPKTTNYIDLKTSLT